MAMKSKLRKHLLSRNFKTKRRSLSIKKESKRNAKTSLARARKIKKKIRKKRKSLQEKRPRMILTGTSSSMRTLLMKKPSLK